MFTADGRLREEFQDLANAEPPSTTPASATATEPAASPSAAPQLPASAQSLHASAPAAANSGGASSGPIAQPAEPPAAEPANETGAGFQDLVGVLAQTASVYMRQAAQQLENRRELIEMARLHVDLLAVLKEKTHGNLQPQEKALLDDALYQLRMAFVEVGG